MRIRLTAALVVVLATLAWLVAPALAASSARWVAPASATSPLRLTIEITDHSGARGDRQGEVQAAIRDLYARDRIKLYVVYVPTFSGANATARVDQTAALNGLGRRDILLGVATSDRNYAVSADPHLGLSTTQLDAVNSVAVEPALRKSDWAAAAIGAAHGYAAEVAGRPVPAPSLHAGLGHGTGPGAPGSGLSASSGLSGGSELAIMVGGAVVLFGLALLTARRLSRHRGGGGGQAGRAGAGGPPGPPTAELEAQASHALVETDDAIRTSEQELGFATARFGEHAAAPFSAALTAARAELAAAFKLRQLLDDDIPDDEATRRSYLTEISERCAEASRLLDEQSEAFDRLQDLEARAAGMVAEVDAHVAQQSARVAGSRHILDRLAVKYTPGSVQAVAANPDQAAERLGFATEGLTQARQALAENQTGLAAVLLQAAESAADQASDLLDGVKHLDAELAQAASALPAGLRETDADLAEAAALLAVQPGAELSSLVARAQSVAAGVRAQLASGAPYDALAALRAIEQADAALDQALAGVREDRARQDRARAVLDQAMLVARSSITAAEDFITTRRGGVGAEARTRLAEAQRHFQQAIGHAQADPVTAVTEAQHADALAQQARSLAEQDVSRFDYAGAGQGQGGGMGAGLGGAILGGILIDGLLGGGRHGMGGMGSLGGGMGRRGGFGLGGGLGPGSFGGMGTRGRNSVGGRF